MKMVTNWFTLALSDRFAPDSVVVIVRTRHERARGWRAGFRAMIDRPIPIVWGRLTLAGPYGIIRLALAPPSRQRAAQEEGRRTWVAWSAMAKVSK